MRFKKHDIITIDNSKEMEILDLLGEGGQGEVYLVSYQEGKYALKVYKDEVDSNFRYNLKNNIDKGSPSANFLWPKLLIDFDDTHCGYLMELRPKNYESFVSYLTGNTLFKDTYTMINWCVELCKSFKELHEKGYSYQDLNDGSFFLDPNTGALLICDNDNVTANKKSLGILGKMRYMAPEIVRGDVTKNGTPQMPDVHSDRFSLAVILFLALCLGNPFEGECLNTTSWMRMLNSRCSDQIRSSYITRLIRATVRSGDTTLRSSKGGQRSLSISRRHSTEPSPQVFKTVRTREQPRSNGLSF